MIAREWALAFATEWIDAWNAHDMNRILSHYTDDFELSSPLMAERLSQSQGVLRGKNAVREYWRPSLSLDPPLQFELGEACANHCTMSANPLYSMPLRI